MNEPAEGEPSVPVLGDRLVGVGGQDSSVVLLSVTVNGPDRVTLSMLMPLSLSTLFPSTTLFRSGLADFWIVSALVWVAVTVFVSVGEFTASVPKNPRPEATFVMLPLSRSAWVIV